MLDIDLQSWIYFFAGHPEVSSFKTKVKHKALKTNLSKLAIFALHKSFFRGTCDRRCLQTKAVFFV